MKQMRLCFVLLQWFFFACFLQTARSQGTENGCIMGFKCVARRLCPSMIHMEKILYVKAKACGRGLVCCPKRDYEETCGLEGNDRSLTELPNSGIPDGKYPWMVALVNERGRYYCSGFLVDQRHVVTAAQCLYRLNSPEEIFAKTGSTDYRRGRRYNITRILNHDYRIPFFYNNIALLSLSEEVDSPDFNPVCLPTKSLGDLEGRDSREIGWGDPYSSKFGENDVQIISGAQCNTFISENVETFHENFPEGINNQLLCAVNSSCGTCFVLNPFFMGGPLMVKVGERWTAVGISSFFRVNGRNGWPVGYTNVTEYVDWIKDSKDAM